MAAPDNRSTPWPDGIDVLIFCAGIVVFLFAGIFVLGTLPDLFGLAAMPQEQTFFRYGGTAVLIWLLFIGTLSFLIGGFAVRRMKRVRARWLSGAVGAAYAFAFIALSLFVPMSQGSVGGKVLVAFLLLFPAAGLSLGALKLKRSISPLQTERPQAGGS